MPTYQKLVASQITPDFRAAAEVVHAEVPEPGPGELLVRNRWAGVNATDVNITAGRYAPGVEAPFDLGAEAVGVVEAVGDGVTGWEVGQAVATMGLGGGYREVQTVAAEARRPGARGDARGAVDLRQRDHGVDRAGRAGRRGRGRDGAGDGGGRRDGPVRRPAGGAGRRDGRGDVRERREGPDGPEPGRQPGGQLPRPGPQSRAERSRTVRRGVRERRPALFRPRVAQPEHARAAAGDRLRERVRGRAGGRDPARASTRRCSRSRPASGRSSCPTSRATTPSTSRGWSG